MRVLFDTCVIIDVLQHREPFWQNAYDCFLAVANRQVDGYITAKAFTDISYLTHRQTHDEQATRRILSNLLRVFDLLDTTGTDCRRALTAKSSDYEDAVMIETAVRSGMDCIVTRNVRDYRNAFLRVFTPLDLLTTLLPRQNGT